MKIPYLSFDHMNAQVKPEIMASFDHCFNKGLYILGEQVKEFEKAYASFNNVKYCIGTANGLDALVLALKALNITSGDEVIVPSNTYIASWLAVSHLGAIPVPVEPN